MSAEIRYARDAVEFATEERCHIVEIGNDAGDEQLSVARARVEPGVTTAWHSLRGISERYLIIAGQGLVEVGDLEPAPVGPGDLVRIPPDVRQRITNTGNEQLVFYALCTPRFNAGAYLSLE